MNFIKWFIVYVLNMPGEPAKGETWLREPNNPFDKSPVMILDVKDGYVLYEYSTGGTSSETIRAFMRMYTIII